MRVNVNVTRFRIRYYVYGHYVTCMLVTKIKYIIHVCVTSNMHRKDCFILGKAGHSELHFYGAHITLTYKNTIHPKLSKTSMTAANVFTLYSKIRNSISR